MMILDIKTISSDCWEGKYRQNDTPEKVYFPGVFCNKEYES